MRDGDWRLSDVMARVGANIGVSYFTGFLGAQFSQYRNALSMSAVNAARSQITRTVAHYGRHALSHGIEATATTIGTFVSGYVQARMSGRYLTKDEILELITSAFVGLGMGATSEHIHRQQALRLVQSTGVIKDHCQAVAHDTKVKSGLAGSAAETVVEATAKAGALVTRPAKDNGGKITVHTETDLRRQALQAEVMGEIVRRTQLLADDDMTGRSLAAEGSRYGRVVEQVVRAAGGGEGNYDDQRTFVARFKGKPQDAFLRFAAIGGEDVPVEQRARNLVAASRALCGEINEQFARFAEGHAEPTPPAVKKEIKATPERRTMIGGAVSWVAETRPVRAVTHAVGDYLIRPAASIIKPVAEPLAKLAASAARTAPRVREVPILGAAGDEAALGTANALFTYHVGSAMLPGGAPLISIPIAAEGPMIATELAYKVYKGFRREVGAFDPVNRTYRARPTTAAEALALRAQADEMLSLVREVRGKGASPQVEAELARMESALGESRREASSMYSKCNRRLGSIFQWAFGRGIDTIDAPTSAKLEAIVHDAAQRGQGFGYGKMIDSLNHEIRSGLARGSMSPDVLTEHLGVLLDRVHPDVARRILDGLPAPAGPHAEEYRLLVDACRAELGKNVSTDGATGGTSLYGAHRSRTTSSAQRVLESFVDGVASPTLKRPVGEGEARQFLALIDELQSPNMQRLGNRPSSRDEILAGLRRYADEILEGHRTAKTLTPEMEARIRGLQRDIDAVANIERRAVDCLFDAADVEQLKTGLRGIIEPTDGVLSPIRQAELLAGLRDKGKRAFEARAQEYAVRLVRNRGDVPPEWQHLADGEWAPKVGKARAADAAVQEQRARVRAAADDAAAAEALQGLRTAKKTQKKAYEDLAKTISGHILKNPKSELYAGLDSWRKKQAAIDELAGSLDLSSAPRRVSSWDGSLSRNYLAADPVVPLLSPAERTVPQRNRRLFGLNPLGGLGEGEVQVSPLARLDQEGYRSSSVPIFWPPPRVESVFDMPPQVWPLGRKEVNRIFDVDPKLIKTGVKRIGERLPETV
jgi:hypothetical protein